MARLAARVLVLGLKIGVSLLWRRLLLLVVEGLLVAVRSGRSRTVRRGRKSAASSSSAESSRTGGMTVSADVATSSRFCRVRKSSRSAGELREQGSCA